MVKGKDNGGGLSVVGGIMGGGSEATGPAGVSPTCHT